MKPTAAMISMRMEWDEDRETMLREQEEIIKNGRGAFEKVAKALSLIKLEGLYLKSHRSFREYCEDKWGFTRQWAYKLLDAVAVKKELAGIKEKLNEKGRNGVKKMEDLGPEGLVSLKDLSRGELKKVATKAAGEPQLTTTRIRELVDDVKVKESEGEEIVVPPVVKNTAELKAALTEQPNKILEALDSEWAAIQKVMAYVEVKPSQIYKRLRLIQRRYRLKMWM